MQADDIDGYKTANKELEIARKELMQNTLVGDAVGKPLADEVRFLRQPLMRYFSHSFKNARLCHVAFLRTALHTVKRRMDLKTGLLLETFVYCSLHAL